MVNSINANFGAVTVQYNIFTGGKCKVKKLTKHIVIRHFLEIF